MKKYVKVTATFDCDGDLIPEYIVWDDGRRYRIDKISDVRYAAERARKILLAWFGTFREKEADTKC